MSHDWNINNQKNKGLVSHESAILVGIILPDQDPNQVTEYLEELEFLTTTAGAETKAVFTQRLKHPDKRHFIGKGKVEELKNYVEEHDIDMVIFDDDLTPSQTANLEKELKRKIIDRSYLILDIFASRASTAQAKTQVELAQMQYLLPRLRGLWTHLERQKGGIGMRGPGEQEIETDRRIVREKIKKLQLKLEKIDLQNISQRKNRGELIRVALVGYTNVGKSTLMNLLSKSEVYMEDKLFATLDTTVRKVVFGTMPFLLSDTVGFIRKLPHHLIESFKSTLDEAKESDILIHVFDLAHPQHEDHIRTVNQTLLDLKVEDKPVFMVGNKLDMYRDKNFDDLLTGDIKEDIISEIHDKIQNEFQPTDLCLISAIEKEGLVDLKEKLRILIETEYHKRYPHQVKTW